MNQPENYQLLMITGNSKKAVFKYNGQVHTEPIKKNREGLMYHTVLDNIVILPKQFQQATGAIHYLTIKKNQ